MEAAGVGGAAAVGGGGGGEGVVDYSSFSFFVRTLAIVVVGAVRGVGLGVGGIEIWVCGGGGCGGFFGFGIW